jgi:hypothetical protein
MLPVIIFAAVAVPLLLIGFVAVRRKAGTVEHTTPEGQAADAATQEEYEQEFADAEAYQEKWREEQHKLHPDDKLY